MTGLVLRSLKTMLRALKTPMFVTVLVCVTLASTVAAAQAPPLQSVIFEGPGARTPLTSWTLRQGPRQPRPRARLAARRLRRAHRQRAERRQPHPLHGTARRGQLRRLRRLVSHELPRAGDRRVRAQLPIRQLPRQRLGRRPRARLAPGLLPAVRIPPQARRRRAHGRRPRRLARSRGAVARGLSPHVVQLGRPRRRGRRAPDRRKRAVATEHPDHAHARHAESRRRQRQGQRRRPQLRTEPHARPRRLARARRADDRARASRPLTLAHDQSATTTARASIHEPALWSHASPNLYRMQLAVGSESSYSAARRPAPAHLARRARVPQRSAAAPARRLDPGGRAGTRRRAHARQSGRDRRRAEGDRRQRRALAASAGPGAARTSRRSRHPRVAGDRTGGRGSATGTRRRRSCCAEAEQQARTAVLAAQLHPSIFAWNLVDEVAENGRDAPEVAYVQTHRPLAARDTTPRGWSPWTCGAITRPSTPARCTREADAVAETDYTGWYDSPHDTPAQLAGEMRAPAGGDGAHVRRQGARDQRVRRRIQHAQPARQPRQLRLPGATARRAHRRLRGRPEAQRDARSGCCATTR